MAMTREELTNAIIDHGNEYGVEEVIRFLGLTLLDIAGMTVVGDFEIEHPDKGFVDVSLYSDIG